MKAPGVRSQLKSQAKQLRSKGRSSDTERPAKRRLRGKPKDESFDVPIRDVTPRESDDRPPPTTTLEEAPPTFPTETTAKIELNGRLRSKTKSTTAKRRDTPLSEISKDSIFQVTTARGRRRRAALPMSSSSESSVEHEERNRKSISFVSPPRVARPFNPSILAMELHGSVPFMTVEWLLQRILGSRKSGGAHLDVALMLSSDVTGPVLHISAPTQRLLEVAERVGLVKMTRFGTVRRFSKNRQHLFYDVKDPLSEPLSSVEKQQMVMHELMNARCLETDLLIPGLHNARIDYGQRIVPECLRIGIITHLFPVHENELRLLTVHPIAGPYKKNISKYIIPSYASQADAVRIYLGEGIAFYLAFLRFVAIFLTFPAILGLALISASGMMFFVGFRSLPWMVLLPAAVLTILWSAILLYVWRRTSDFLCVHWGTQRHVLLLADQLKPTKQSMGALRRKPPPPRTRLYHRTLIKVYVVSIPLTVLILCFYFYLLTVIWPGFKCFDDPESSKDDHTVKRTATEQEQINVFELAVPLGSGQPELTDILCFGPAVGASLLCWIFGRLYVKLGYALTDWEHHQTQRSFENYLVTKVALFAAAINFGPVYYLLLIRDELNATWVLLVTLITTHIVFNLLQETIFFKLKECVRHLWHEMPDYLVPSEIYLNQHSFHEFTPGSASFAILIRNYPLEKSYLQERNMPSYKQKDETGDYTELFILLAFVSSFLILMPLLGLLAFLYCWLKLVIKMHKLSTSHQRPLARTATDIGPWTVVLEVTTFASVATNCLLLNRSSNLREALGPNLSDAKWTAIFVVVQHGLFILLVVMVHYSPRCPWLPEEADSDDWKSTSHLEDEYEQALQTTDSSRTSIELFSESQIPQNVPSSLPTQPADPNFFPSQRHPPSPSPPTPIRDMFPTKFAGPSPEDDLSVSSGSNASSPYHQRARSLSPKRQRNKLKKSKDNLTDDSDDEVPNARDDVGSGERNASRSDSASSSSTESESETKVTKSKIYRPRSRSETYVKNQRTHR